MYIFNIYMLQHAVKLYLCKHYDGVFYVLIIFYCYLINQTNKPTDKPEQNALFDDVLVLKQIVTYFLILLYLCHYRTNCD